MPKLFTDEDQKILFEGVDIEDDNQNEFMVKMESMITSKVSELTESFEAEKESLLEGYKTEISEDMEGKIDSYLDYVVESWIEDNELALESGIKMDILEGFVSGLKTLYEDNNINLDEDSVDVIAKSDEKISGLQGDLDESIQKVSELKESLEEFKRGIIIDQHAVDLTESEKEKLETLVEGVEYVSDDTFNEKVKIIRESYFKNDDGNDDGDADPVKAPLTEEVVSKDDYISNLAKLL